MINQNIHQIINQNINYNKLPNIIQKLQRNIVMETVTDYIPSARFLSSKGTLVSVS